MPAPTLIWFRQDLRLADNPALQAAAKNGPIIALYVLDDTVPWQMGAASRWWLYHALCDLKKNLARHRIPLVLKRGHALSCVPDVAQQLKAGAVFWNRVYEPAAVVRDTKIKAVLKERGVMAQSYTASLLYEPLTVLNKSGQPFKVFTPFSKACLASAPPAKPLPVPHNMHGAAINIVCDHLDDWGLTPIKPDWSKPLATSWAIGEDAAEKRLHAFLEQGLAHYASGRDRPDHDYTSRLSPYLHFGQISPHTCFHAAHALRGAAVDKHIDKFISEILWREFSYHLLSQFPALPDKPLNPAYEKFPWQENAALFKAWRKGQTGIPIVDAGMRQLWQTGWMHNRVRMIVASLLIKNMLQPWQAGEAWFWDCLVDADLASNAASWQWVAGCGADAAPYYRIFNPVLQGLKFDPDGAYVRRYVPELSKLPPEHIHAPWEAAPLILADCGVVFGKTYPSPVVDLKQSRERALAALATIKQESISGV